MDVKSNDSRISKYFDLPPLGQTEQCESLRATDALYTPKFPMLNPNFIFGIEIEVENIKNPKLVSNEMHYWNITTDNSLRNNGYEFVSLPLKASQLENALCQLDKSLPKEREFSPRTSVHVHMNVRDLTLEQITNLLILYTTVENLLFKWIGQDRDKNIFCTKLTETDYVENYIALNSHPQNTIHYWNKYTSFNLHPIESKGTVEFRHMYGTMDKEKILTWINLLSALKIKAKSSKLNQLLMEVFDLNTTSMYEIFLHNIFQQDTYQLLRSVYKIEKEMADPISYIKLATINKGKQESPRLTIRPTATNRFFDREPEVEANAIEEWLNGDPIDVTIPPPTRTRVEELPVTRAPTIEEMIIAEERARIRQVQLQHDAIRGQRNTTGATANINTVRPEIAPTLQNLLNRAMRNN